MLDPDYLERAGDMVCGVYSEIEADLCDHLVRAMLAGDIGDWRSQLALQLLAQGQAPQLRMVLERHRGKVRRAVREEVEEALRRSDAADLMVVREALGVDLPKVTTQQVAAVVRTITEMLERDNVDLMNGARDAFLREATWAVTQTNVGMLSPDAAVERATRRLARRGIDVVQYRDPTTGDKTVRNRVDVAMRRHIRSQLQQACNERTMQVCRDAGCDFVEVSSHYGARPSHQDWEGRRYHVGGRVTVGDETFEDFAEATGYYGTGSHGALGDRLCGVNCRHSFGPWVPGMPHAYEPDPRHPSGKSNEEIYALTQRQRAMERGIRDTKRELKAAEATYEANPTLKNQTEANKVRDSLRRQQERLAKLCEENKDVLKRQANREGPIDTRGSAPKGTGVTLDDYLKTPEVAKRLKDAGMSRTEARRRIASSMRTGGEPARAFSHRTATQQRAELDKALSSQNREEKRRRRDAATMERVRRESPESLKIPFDTDEALAVYGSTTLASNITPEVVNEIARNVEEAITSGDPARANAARLFASDAGSNRLKIRIDDSANTSYYDPSTRTITLNSKGKASVRTIFHEDAHLHDHQLDVTYTDEKITQTGTETCEYTTPTGQYTTPHYGEERGRGMTLMRRLGTVNHNGETAAWRDLKRRLGTTTDAGALATIDGKIASAGLLDENDEYSLVHNLSDIIHAVSNGRVHFGFGHFEPDFWSDGNHRILEVWANYSASLVTNPREAALIRELFPNEAAIMEEIMEAMQG